jgi:hypothetical protein
MEYIFSATKLQTTKELKKWQIKEGAP